MRLILLVALTMVAFAGNSVLNRLAVAELGMGVLSFAVIRVAAGAAMLVALVWIRDRRLLLTKPSHWGGPVALATYVLGFSYAYQSLGAGLGALVLFGSLQLMMFGWAVWRAEPVRIGQWFAMTVALLGLVVLLWPSQDANVPFGGALSMLIATAGWAVYTILGQGARDALGQTAQNFTLCLPLICLALLAVEPGPLGGGLGVLTAVTAGALTSGLGYALWYRVLPRLTVTQAALAQLSVPVVAVLGGAAILAEPITGRMLFAAALVVGGIALAIGPKAQADHS